MLFNQNITPVQIIGPAGELEAIVEKPSVSPLSIVAILCHPHPLHGGSMTNKVVTTLAKALQHLGVWTVRFNFRGVGKSAGKFGNAIGEVDDLNAVISWVKKNFPKDFSLWLGGFSFGSYVAAKVATEIPVEHLILIAPAVHQDYFTQLSEITNPWLVVQGEADEVVPPEEVYAWINQRHNKPRVIRVPKVGHFFHGELIQLRNLLEDDLRLYT